MLCEGQVLARKSLHIQTYHQSVLSHPRSLKTLTRFTRLGVKTVSCYTMRRSSSSRGVADGIGKLVNSELDTEALMQLAGEEWDRQQAEKKSASRRREDKNNRTLSSVFDEERGAVYDGKQRQHGKPEQLECWDWARAEV